MDKRRRTTDLLIPALTVLSDIVAIEGAFLLAYTIRLHTPLFDMLGFPAEDRPPLRAYILGSVVTIFAWLLLFNNRKMYGARRSVVLGEEFLNVIQVVSFGMLIVMSAGFLYRGFSYSRGVVGLLWILAILLVTVGRTIVLNIERRQYRRGLQLQDAIVLGNGPQAGQVFAKLHGHPSFGFRINGYFAHEPAAADSALSAARYLGPPSDAPAYVRQHQIERAFIALSAEDHATLFNLITECEGVNVEFMIVPDVLEVLTSQVRLRELEGIPFLRVKGIPFTLWGRITKRAFDVVVSGISCILLSPLFLLIPALIRLESRGPIFYRQRRVGLDGREFEMIKFRSMVVDAEAQDVVMGVHVQDDITRGIGAKGDPRRTRVGAILRATSMDELPQLLNVLTGEMSLVGPRPERPHFVKELQTIVPRYLDRHRVKTGLTGWAQVNGLRGDTSIAERIKFDLYYIENWSLALDIRILLRTLKEIFTFREQE
jgi:exopolysaccharide biosynthesis polyprenyl glycosylphosphotransferase